MSYALSSPMGDASDYVPWELVPDAWQPDDVAASHAGAGGAASGAGPAACAAAGGTWDGTTCTGASEAATEDDGTGTRYASGGGSPTRVGAPVSPAMKTVKSALPWVFGAAALGTLLWLFARAA